MAQSMFQLAELSWNVTKEIHSVWLKRLNKASSMAILASGPFIDVIYYHGLSYPGLWYLTAEVENLKRCDSLKTKPQVIWTALASFRTSFCFFIGQDTWDCQLLKSFNVAKCHLFSGWLIKAIQCSSQYPPFLKIYILSDVININQKLWLYLTTGCCLSTSLQTNKHDNILFSFSGIPSFHTRINKLCIWEKNQ